MKIICDKCGKVLNIPINNAFEQNKVGKIICPECKKVQKRYISEVDLLLYFGVSEIVYLFISLFTMFVFQSLGVTWNTGLLMFAVLIGSYFVLKYISTDIYEKAYFKQATKDTNLELDAREVSNSLYRQLLFFFVIAITFITSATNRIFFAILLVVAIVLNFIKLKFAIEKEQDIAQRLSERKEGKESK